MPTIKKPHTSRGEFMGIFSGEFAPPEIPGVSTTDSRGVVPLELLLRPLVVRIPKWDPDPTPATPADPSIPGDTGDPGDPEHILQLWWDSDDGPRQLDQLIVRPAPPAIPAFHDLRIRLADLRSRSRIAYIYYSVRLVGGETLSEPKIPITIDLERPALIRPTDAAQFVVPPVPALTEQYLIDNPRPAFFIPVYNIRALNDRIEFMLSNSPTLSQQQADGGSPVDFGTTPWTATLDAEAFRRLNNGPAYVFYRIFDETGNFSEVSAALPFVMGLAGAALPPPIIRPPIYNDQLIKRDDARLDEGGGVFVRIVSYPGWSAAAQHSVIVYWNERPTTSQVVSQLPFDVEIPWTVLRGTNAVLAAETVPVRYEISGLDTLPKTSAPLPVNVNLTIAGQDHGNAPAMLNPELAPVEVMGRTGTNTLTDEDVGLPVRVRVRLFNSSAPPRVGDFLNLMWNGAGPVATYQVSAGDAAGSVVFFPNVPWSVVDITSNAVNTVYYTTTNGFNEQRSNPVSVTARITPLPAPTVKNTLFNTYFTCRSVPGVKDGVIWGVAPNSSIHIGDNIKFVMQGFSANNWDVKSLLPSVVYTQSLLWEQAHRDSGAKIAVNSFDAILFPLRNFASATGTYEVWRDGVMVGKSSSGRIRIDLTYSTGVYCSPRGNIPG